VGTCALRHFVRGALPLCLQTQDRRTLPAWFVDIMLATILWIMEEVFLVLIKVPFYVFIVVPFKLLIVTPLWFLLRVLRMVLRLVLPASPLCIGIYLSLDLIEQVYGSETKHQVTLYSACLWTVSMLFMLVVFWQPQQAYTHYVAKRYKNRINPSTAKPSKWVYKRHYWTAWTCTPPGQRTEDCHEIKVVETRPWMLLIPPGLGHIWTFPLHYPWIIWFFCLLLFRAFLLTGIKVRPLCVCV
jgi:hypothetical protein